MSMVLILKAIMLPTTDSAVYEIRSRDFIGFQLGDPVRRPVKMCLHLYTEDIEIEIVIDQAPTGPVPAITQAE